MSKVIPLPDAALRLGMSYLSARDALLRGDIAGRRDPVTRRWVVDAESVERARLVREQQTQDDVA